ncbi:hypothetical protein AAK967_02355 [Atopobiaceae bacterium 24-176]
MYIDMDVDEKRAVEMLDASRGAANVVRRKLGKAHATLLGAIEAATVTGRSELISHVANALVAVDRAREDL